MPKEAEIRQGFRQQDRNYLRQFDNPKSEPQLQIFTDEDIDEDPEDKRYFCAMCKTRLDYHEGIEAWSCEGCGQMYDTRLQDKPLVNTEDFKLVPYTAQRHYAPFDADDPMLPYVDNVDVDKIAGEAEVIEIVKQSPNTRIKHIRVKGSPVEAMAAMKEADSNPLE